MTDRASGNIRLGLMAPLTGLVELYGPEIRWAGTIACEEVNERGGVLGRPLDLVIVDDGSLPATAVPAAERLIEREHCAAIIGNLLSNSRISVAYQVAEPRRIPYLNFSFYEGSIFSRYFFHFAALPNQQIDKMIPYMAARFGPKMFFAGSNYEWPRGSLDAARQALERIGGEIVGEEYIPIGSSDVEPLLGQIARSGADVLVPYFAGADQINLLTRFTEMGLKDRMAVVMGHYDEAMVRYLPPHVREGFYSSNTYFMSVDTDESRRYLERLKRQRDVTGIWPHGNGVLTNFGEGTYLCVHAFAKAANMAGSTDPEDLVEKLQHISVTGPQGIVDMNPLIHHAKVSTYLARCEADGTFTIIEKFGRIDPVIPERYMIEAGLHQSMPPATPDRQFSTKPIIPVADRQMGIANIDTKGRFVHVTDDFCALFNKNDSEILSEETLLSLAFPHEIDEGAYLFTQLLSGSLSHVEGHCSAEGSDGILRHLHFDIATARNPSQICSFVMRVWPYHLISELGRPLPDEPEPATREPHLTAIAIVAKNGWIAYANNSFLKLWGYSRLDEVLGSDIASFWVAGKGIHDLLLLADSSSEWTGELAAQTRQGLRKQLRVTIERSDGEENQAWGYTLSCVEPRASLSQGRADDSTSGRILSVAEIAILSTDQEGVIFQASRHAASLFGYSEEELVGMSVHTLVPPRFRERHRGHFTRFLQSPISELPMASSRSEVGGYRKDGSEFPAEASLSKFRGADGWVVVITLMDVTEKKKTEKELIWQATHDPLTLLPNRSLMRDRLINALERSKRPQSMVALLFIDLDGFKLINDTYGHESGDSILTTIGDKLVQIVRPGDTVARFGGDEFVILCEQISDETAIPALATRIIEELRQPFRFNGHELFVTASIGLAYGSGQTHTADELIRNADAAMYTAKEEGRDGWRIYNENIHEKVRNQLTIAHGLRAAIERNEFELYLQPVVDTMENRIIGAEALLRWHPPFGEVPPSQFIPVAEMTGAITSIGMWVFEQACLLQKRIVEQRGEASSFFISVNVSTRQLSEKGFVGQITRVLERTGAVPEDIVVEITETALMSDIEMNLMALQELGKLGLKLAVDDFGTGYSSLGQLIRMPVDKLKIDRIFVDGMFRQDSARSIVAAIVNMASALGLAVIAEGVETREHVEGLKALGCGLAQGYYFARPMTTQDFETFALREN